MLDLDDILKLMISLCEKQVGQVGNEKVMMSDMWWCRTYISISNKLKSDIEALTISKYSRIKLRNYTFSFTSWDISRILKDLVVSDRDEWNLWIFSCLCQFIWACQISTNQFVTVTLCCKKSKISSFMTDPKQFTHKRTKTWSNLPCRDEENFWIFSCLDPVIWACQISTNHFVTVSSCCKKSKISSFMTDHKQFTQKRAKLGDIFLGGMNKTSGFFPALTNSSEHVKFQQIILTLWHHSLKNPKFPHSWLITSNPHTKGKNLETFALWGWMKPVDFFLSLPIHLSMSNFNKSFCHCDTMLWKIQNFLIHDWSHAFHTQRAKNWRHLPCGDEWN